MIETFMSPAGMTATMVLLGVLAVRALYRITSNVPGFVEKVAMSAVVIGILGIIWWASGI